MDKDFENGEVPKHHRKKKKKPWVLERKMVDFENKAFYWGALLEKYKEWHIWRRYEKESDANTGKESFEARKERDYYSSHNDCIFRVRFDG